MTALGSLVTDLAVFDALAAGEADPARRTQVEVLRAHFQAEFFDLDIDALMATMISEPRFAYYGMGRPSFLVGYKEVRDHYLANFEAGADQAGVIIENIAVGHDVIAMEGVSVMTKDFVEAFLPSVVREVGGLGYFVVKKRTCSVFPFEGGKMRGETLYFDGSYSAADAEPSSPPSSGPPDVDVM
jgi:hypothetical protein